MEIKTKLDEASIQWKEFHVKHCVLPARMISVLGEESHFLVLGTPHIMW